MNTCRWNETTDPHARHVQAGGVRATETDLPTERLGEGMTSEES